MINKQMDEAYMILKDCIEQEESIPDKLFLAGLITLIIFIGKQNGFSKKKMELFLINSLKQWDSSEIH